MNRGAIGILCAVLVLGWQFLTVRYNYHGQWSALFCTGERASVPPLVAREHPYLFPGVEGWDGQWYHAMAHDPLMRRGADSAIDPARARRRYRRILVPAVAYALAGGSDAYVDIAYRAVILLFFALGGWWLACLAEAAGRSGWWGLAFLLLPASVAAIDREAVDVGLIALCGGFALSTRYLKNPVALYAVLVCAGLVRETGLLLIAAYCVWLAIEREFRKCAVFATAAVPTMAWYAFVNSRTVEYAGDSGIAVPFSGVVNRLIHPMGYAGGGAIVGLIQSMDFLAALGVLLAMMMAFRFVWRRWPDAVDLAILLFALLGILNWRPYDWPEVLDYARILTPLLVYEAMEADGGPLWPGLLPLCMVLPRLGIQMSSQALGIARHVLPHVIFEGHAVR